MKMFFLWSMSWKARKRRLVILALLVMSCAGCSGSHLVVREDRQMELCGCPPIPMCVSSSSFMPYNRVLPFVPAVPLERAWEETREAVKRLPRTFIVEERPGYLHAKCTSLVFRFVDNLEFLLDRDRGIIEVRSASSIALFDLGVNYFRVRSLRNDLADRGVLRETGQ